MDLKWLKTKMIMILSVGLCLVFTVTEAQPSITINGRSSSRITLRDKTMMHIGCTVPSSITSYPYIYIYKDYKIDLLMWPEYKKYQTVTRKTTCEEDNAFYRCHYKLKGKDHFSKRIYVTVNCPPRWAEAVQQPVIFKSPPSGDAGFRVKVIGYPHPTYSVQKFTSTGLEDLSPNILVLSSTNYVGLHFYTYAEDSHGVYQVVAKNKFGTFTSNFTLRGLLLPPKNLNIWKTTSDSVQLEWTAGEIFWKAESYTLLVIHKKEDGLWGILDSFLPSTESYTVNSLQPNTTYYFLVKAYYKEHGESSYSNMAQATTLKPCGAYGEKDWNWFWYCYLDSR